MRQLYWRMRIAWLALRWVLQLNLGDEVWYQGERWMLVQGVCRPYWDIQHTVHGVRNHIHVSSLRKVRSLRNWWSSFRSGYRFYMGYWYDIWVRAGIQPWMRGCHIWPWPCRKDGRRR